MLNACYLVFNTISLIRLNYTITVQHSKLCPDGGANAPKAGLPNTSKP